MDQQTIIEIIKEWISIPYLLTFIFISLGVFEKTKLKFLRLNLFKKEVTINKTWLVLILAFIVAIPFYFLLDGEQNIVIMKLIISYSLATSLYELLIKNLMKIFKKEEN